MVSRGYPRLNDPSHDDPNFAGMAYARFSTRHIVLSHCQLVPKSIKSIGPVCYQARIKDKRDEREEIITTMEIRAFCNYEFCYQLPGFDDPRQENRRHVDRPLI